MQSINHLWPKSEREHFFGYLFWFFYVIFVAVAIAIFPYWVAGGLFLPVVFIIFFGGGLRYAPPLKMIRYMFLGYLVSNLLWPRYLALQLPGPDLNLQRLFLVSLLALVLIAASNHKTRVLAVEKISRHYVWFLILFLIFFFRFLATIFGVSPAVSIGPFANEIVELFLVFLIAYFSIGSFVHAKRLLLVIMVCAIFVSVMAIGEYFLKRNLFSAFSLPGIALDPEYLQQALSDKSRHGAYRSQAAFFHPLLLAEFCVFSLPIAFYFFKAGTRLVRAVSVFAIFLVPIGAFASGSRSAFVIVTVVCLLCILQIIISLIQSKMFGFLGWFFIFFGFLLSLATIGYFFESGVADSVIYGQGLREQQSTTARIFMYKFGIPALIASPIFGYGLGTAAMIVGFSANGSYSIDSFFLSYSVESGVPSLLLFLIFIIGPFVHVALFSRNINKSDGKYLVAFLAIGVFGVILVKSILSLNGNTYLLFISTAIALRASDWFEVTK